ncbi:MAG: ComF family protein [Acidobacteria bacterium]|nr:ComF family protein [Acidobacteriota bacterium]
MSAVKVDPMKLQGPWADGYVLERQHTLSSEFLGHDSFGKPQFDTKRAELGELVFRLKNRSDRNTLDSIAETAVRFIESWNPTFDLIVPMPPSRKRAAYQPVVEIAMAIGKRLSKPVSTAAVNKIKDTPELKDVFDYQQRLKLLQGAFHVNHGAVGDKRILLLDDLYRSGATATVVAQDLVGGGAAAVYMLAMTKTRTRT